MWCAAGWALASSSAECHTASRTEEQRDLRALKAEAQRQAARMARERCRAFLSRACVSWCYNVAKRTG